MDLDSEQAMPTVTRSVSELTEAAMVDVAVLSAAGDATGWTEAPAVHVALPLAIVHVSGSTETMEVDVVLSSAAGDNSESTQATKVDVALPSAAEDAPVPTEATKVDVAVPSAGIDVFESTAAREVDLVVPLATFGCASESTDAPMVDVAVPSVTGVSSELAETTMVDVGIPFKVGDVIDVLERVKVDVAMASGVVDLSMWTVTPEVDVVDVSGSKETTEVDAVMPSASGNERECVDVREGNVALAGGDPVSKLVNCINHFCPAAEDTSAAAEATDYMVKPELLEATAHAIEAAGNEGLSIPQLARIMGRIGHEMTEEALEMYISALETFDVVKQVNAYDHKRIIAAARSAPFFIHVKARNGGRSGTDAETSDKGNGGSNNGLSTMATLTSIATGSRNWTRNILPNLPTVNSHRRVTLSPEQDNDSEVSHTVPMLPWLTGDGGVNITLLKSLTRRVLGVVMQNPGILEEHLVDQLHILNPQTARQFLQLLELDGHVKVRKFLRAQPPAPPGRLGHLIKVKPPASTKPTFGSHYFANCTSGTLL